MQLSGKLVIISIFGVAIAGAVLTLWFQYEARRRSREFWGSENAVLIGRADTVELWQLSESAADADGELSLDGKSLSIIDRKDVSKAPGMVHVRDAMIRDSGFQWDVPRGDCLAHWEYAFRFVGGQDEVLVAIDTRCQRIRRVGSGSGANIAPMFRGLKQLIERETAGE